MRDINITNYSFSGPAKYRICVYGAATATLTNVLGQMDIHDSSFQGVPSVELTGWMSDQAALMGVLNTLHNLHYSIAFMEVVP